MTGNIRILLIFNSVYVLLLSIFSLLNINSSIVLILPVCTALFFIIRDIQKIKRWRVSNTEFIILFLLIIALPLHFMFAKNIAIGDTIKFYFIFLFYFLGAKSKIIIDNPKLIYYILPLVILPIVCLLIFIVDSRVYNESANTILFFSNRNNTVAFTFVAIFALTAMKGDSKFTYFILFGVAILYSTLGLMLAFIIAIIFVNLKFSYRALMLLFIFTTAFTLSFFYSGLPIFERVAIMLDGAINFFSMYKLEDVRYVDFGDFVKLQGGSNDVSMFFRLKHWTEIIYIMSTDWFLLIPGWGMSTSVNLTSLALVPHNDWLRVLFELGIINFIAFGLLSYNIYRKLKNVSKQLVIIFLTINIYFFSENLINNFLITSFLYFISGLVIHFENFKYRA